MNVDGYIKFAVDTTGEKTWVVEYKANDIQLEDYFREFMGETADDLVDLGEVEKINPDIKNSMLLVTFAYRSVSSFNGESTDYDDETEVRDVIVLDTDYKTTWQKNLTTMYGFSTLEELKDNECMNDIHEWEEFYGEDFEFFKPKVIESPFLEFFETKKA
jgi:hypothetical protein